MDTNSDTDSGILSHHAVPSMCPRKSTTRWTTSSVIDLAWLLSNQTVKQWNRETNQTAIKQVSATAPLVACLWCAENVLKPQGGRQAYWASPIAEWSKAYVKLFFVPNHCVVSCGVVWCVVCGMWYVVWHGVVLVWCWCPVLWCVCLCVRCGVMWCVVRCGVLWCAARCTAVWRGLMQCNLVRFGVVSCGVVWCNVLWHSVVWPCVWLAEVVMFGKLTLLHCGVMWCAPSLGR